MVLHLLTITLNHGFPLSQQFWCLSWPAAQSEEGCQRQKKLWHHCLIVLIHGRGCAGLQGRIQSNNRSSAPKWARDGRLCAWMPIMRNMCTPQRQADRGRASEGHFGGNSSVPLRILTLSPFLNVAVRYSQAIDTTSIVLFFRTLAPR